MFGPVFLFCAATNMQTSQYCGFSMPGFAPPVRTHLCWCFLFALSIVMRCVPKPRLQPPQSMKSCVTGLSVRAVAWQVRLAAGIARLSHHKILPYPWGTLMFHPSAPPLTIPRLLSPLLFSSLFFSSLFSELFNSAFFRRRRCCCCCFPRIDR